MSRTKELYFLLVLLEEWVIITAPIVMGGVDTMFEYRAAESKRPYYDNHFYCIGECNKAITLSKIDATPNSLEIPSNCDEAAAAFGVHEGIYLLKPTASFVYPIFFYCIYESRKTKAWTVIQRRESGFYTFHRNFSEYKYGFGDLNDGFWIGLERIYQITLDNPHELWIVLKEYKSETEQHIKYSTFSVSSAEDSYRLTIGGYSGSVEDSFSSHNNAKFSTFDNDNDGVFFNCARLFKGGWWYTRCFECNLNGAFYSSSNRNTNAKLGIVWKGWKGFDESLRYTRMAIRPVKS